MKNENEIFQIILHSGDARNSIMEAMRALRCDDYARAHKCIEEANRDLNKVHKAQSLLISDEINGEVVEISLLMIHAQDHLMTTMAMRDFTKEMILLWEAKMK